MMKQFKDRNEAGQRLAEQLTDYADEDAIVLALPRGGLPVAYPVAEKLNAPLDVFVVRKLGAPHNEELAIGAIASGDVRVLHDDVIAHFDIDQSAIERIEERERRELKRREEAYRGDRAPLDVQGRTVILVDDGIATGATMEAAIAGLRQRDPARMVIAVPAASEESCRAFRQEVHEVVCVITPQHFRAVGMWYQHFPQTTDDEVRDILERAAQRDIPQPTR